MKSKAHLFFHNSINKAKNYLSTTGQLNTFFYAIPSNSIASKVFWQPVIFLKIPSHQILSAWKRYGWIGLDEYVIADGYKIFKSHLPFYILIYVPLAVWQNMICVACNSRILHAKQSKGKQITFCNSTKGYLNPFSKLPKGNRAPHAIHFDFSRILLDFAVANTLLHAAKRN